MAFFACALAGIAFVPLSWRNTPRELADVLRRSEPALVLIDDEYASLAEEGAARARPRAADGRTRLDRGRGVRSAGARIARAARPSATTTRCW